MANATLKVRLNEFEMQAINKMAKDSEAGVESTADLVRLWIHREINKRKGTGVPKPFEFQGVYRIGGRPKTKFRVEQ